MSQVIETALIKTYYTCGEDYNSLVNLLPDEAPLFNKGLRLKVKTTRYRPARQSFALFEITDIEVVYARNSEWDDGWRQEVTLKLLETNDD